MVVTPMRTRYDQFGKQMVRTALEPCGPVETDAEVPADTRRIDLWFMPDPARESVPDHLGVLGRIAGGSSTLQAEAPERALALPILLRLRLTVPSDPTKQTTDDQEFLMDTQDIVETWRREAVQEGIKQNAVRSLVEVYEARFGAMPADLRAAVEDVDDEPTLVGWLRIVATRSAGEVAATIRAFRAS
jgi:hypothetical protein